VSLSVAEVCYFQERFGNAVISIDDLIIGEPVGEGEGNKHYNYNLYVKKLLNYCCTIYRVIWKGSQRHTEE